MHTNTDFIDHHSPAGSEIKMGFRQTAQKPTRKNTKSRKVGKMGKLEKKIKRSHGTKTERMNKKKYEDYKAINRGLGEGVEFRPFVVWFPTRCSVLVLGSD